jgi:nucleoside transporter
VDLSFVLLAGTDAPPLSLGVRIPLSVMNFLELAIWGAWWVVLGQYLETLNFSRKQIGRVYATMAIGSIVSPLFVGWLADSVFAAEQLLAALHFVGAGLLFCLARIRNEKTFYWVALLYAFIYSPTLPLANAIVFGNAASSDFPLIRVLGTIGWIAACSLLKLMLKPGQPVNNRPLYLASILSLALVGASFWLPHTPPKADSITRAFEMFHNTSFVIFLAASFVVSAAFAFYFAFTALYLEKRIGVRSDNAGPLMTLGQWVEIGGMYGLQELLPYWGFKAILALGMFMVAARYFIFAIGGPFALIVVAIAMHGLCFDFFLAAGFMYINDVAPENISSSAQSLFSVVTYGLGMYLGTEGAGWLNQRLTRDVVNPATGQTERVTDWRTFWLVPAIGSAVAVVLFLVLFNNAPAKEKASEKAVEAQPEAAMHGKEPKVALLHS